jgi:Arc/MetJ-type ribon-helix-helix transcriptional regulator
MATLTARLDPELTNFITEYQTRYGLKNRTEVIRQALQLLQHRERTHVLREGYAKMAAEQSSDPWLDSGLTETLEATK